MEIPKLPDTLRTEDEIIATWKGGISKPLVSVRCITYNHASYIEDAIKGFLIQETDFPIEVWIHDDASTDGTREIIESYVNRYPNIINAILQNENQYSKGVKVGALLTPHCRGEFYAICEGDDFWIDKCKLAKQIKMMGKFDVEISFTKCVGQKNNFDRLLLADYGDEPKVFSLSEVVRRGGGFIPTPTIVLKKNVYNEIPDWYCQAPVGDYFIQVLGAVKGGALFLPFPGSIYRINAVGSWSLSRRMLGLEKIQTDHKRFMLSLDSLVESGVNKSDVEYAKARQEYLASHELLVNGYYKEAKEYVRKSWLRKRNLHRLQKFIYFSRHILPVARFALNLREKIRYIK